ncbi:PadR family transcriptional regulator [Cellulomonas sp.]|uniref:PadR family transcriptional regulator n=1 Tax=Cellulomonas sp. TaxID=40001 RepID=UPI002D4F2726|nr:PadR family transcriptional regulator [Cellulomonas sp.]HYQ77273.1 PadR family transcriptional regulator [Cellulomonas sp.]
MARPPAQTDLAVLGALSLAPMSGYRVRQEIVSTLGHFWTESFGQIYPALARLEASGDVGRDDAGRFALTPAGRDRLRALLQTPPEFGPPRNGLLLRLFFGRAAGRRTCLDLLAETEREVTRRLAGLADVRATLDPADPDERYALLTLSAGEHQGRATLAWIAETRAALESWAD